MNTKYWIEFDANVRCFKYIVASDGMLIRCYVQTVHFSFILNVFVVSILLLLLLYSVENFQFTESLHSFLIASNRTIQYVYVMAMVYLVRIGYTKTANVFQNSLLLKLIVFSSCFFFSSFVSLSFWLSFLRVSRMRSNNFILLFFETFSL